MDRISTMKHARHLFPHTVRGLNYMNHAATSPLSTRVVEAMNGYLNVRSRGSIEEFERDMAKVAECRESLRTLINAESAERIALVTNTSEALNIVASGLYWKPGDRIVLNDLEFPANYYPYHHLLQFGVEIDTIQCPDGTIAIEAIEKVLSPNTRLVALSAVQFLTGFRADLAAIGELCKRRGILFVVDAIQAVGAVRIDVQAMNIDALACGCQKWLMAPHGTGFLYIKESLQERIQQQYLGWLSVRVPWNFFDHAQQLAQGAKRYEVGTANIIGMYGLAASLNTLLEFNPAEIEAQVLSLTSLLTEELRAVDGLQLISPVEEKNRAGIVTVALPEGVDGAAVHRELERRGIVISIREGKLRYAPHFYNTAEEIRAAILATRDVLHV